MPLFVISLAILKQGQMSYSNYVFDSQDNNYYKYVYCQQKLQMLLNASVNATCFGLTDHHHKAIKYIIQNIIMCA